MLSDQLRPLSAELAHHFERVPTPPSIDTTTTHTGETADPHPDLGPADASVAMLVGPLAAQVAPEVHALADHLGAPVANTWGVKGIYPWDNAHHMGTCGLQRDDFELLGLAEFDVLVTIGLDPAESAGDRITMTRQLVIEPEPGAIENAIAASRPRTFHRASNDLYARIAAVAQPGYVDNSFPRHPARAVAEVKQSLGPFDRLVAQPGRAGLWVARTFPTDRLGRVIVPAYDEPGVAAAVALISATQGTPTVCVLSDPPDHLDAVTVALGALAQARDLPLRWQHWGDDVDWSRTEDLVAAAGPVVAWTR